MNAAATMKYTLLAVIIIATQGIRGQTQVSLLDKLIYTNTASTTNFTVPAGVYAITLEAWGGGGGGGHTTNYGQGCGGGGGGAYAKSIISVVPGDVLTIKVGVGGSGTSNGKNGGASSVTLNGNSNIVVSAAGGTGSTGGNSAGAGGQASSCIYNINAFNGGNGGTGNGSGQTTNASGGGGGGAGSAGSGGKGGDASGNTAGTAGIGTVEYGGNGGAGIGGTGGSDGNNASSANYGGGGGGGKREYVSFGNNRDGGNGRQGLVRISFPTPPTISLSGSNVICEGASATLTTTSPHPVRPVNGWEWILQGVGAGDYTSTVSYNPSPASHPVGTYTYIVRAHYDNITWNGTNYAWLYDDSQNTVSFTVIAKPKIINVITPDTLCHGAVTSAINFISTSLYGNINPLTNVTYYWTNNNPSVLNLTDGNGPVLPAITVSNTGNTQVTATVTVSPVYTDPGGQGQCTGDPVIFTFVVNHEPKISLTSGSQNPSVCDGSAITDIVFTYSGSADTASVSGLTGTGLSAIVDQVNKTVTIYGTPITTPVNYTVTTGGHTAPCSSASVSGTVTVNPAAYITLTDGTQNLIVCEGTAITPIEFTFSGSATGANISGLAGTGLSASVDAINKTVTISGTPASASINYTVSTTGQAASCSPATISGTVTMKQASYITLTYGDQNPTVCNGSAITPVVFTFSGSAIDATVSDLTGTGLSASVNTTAKTVTISGTPTTTPVNYTIETIGHDSPCMGALISGTITVIYPPAIGNITFTDSIYCIGETLVFPSSPSVNATPDTISSGWMLGVDIISDPYSLVYTDNGKTLKYFATNACGTSYSDSVTITVIVTEITSITPSSGPVSGGTYTNDPHAPVDIWGTVKIAGSGFAPFGIPAVSSVSFGGVSATIVSVVNDTITCIPPQYIHSGNVTVSVTALCGTATIPNGYYYEAMNITDLTPDYSPVTGGTSITIRGSGLFVGGDPNLVTVIIGGVPATVISATDAGAYTEIICITGPSNFSKLDSIVIFNGVESRGFPNRFTYHPVTFVANGAWSEPYNWETQTDDRILPYPDAVIHIKANCLQDIDIAMDSISVYPSKSYTLHGSTLEANVFTLKENASFLNDGGNMLALQQNVAHTLPKGRNWYVSSPVQQPQTIETALGTGSSGADLTIGYADYSTNINADWRVEWYDEQYPLSPLNTKWQRLSPAVDNLLITGRGYTVYSHNEDIAVKFSGIYHDGDTVSPILTRQNDANPKRGFNLVGNPFPSYWRWTEASASSANVYSTIWYRTVIDGDYEFWSYNAAGNVAVAPGWNDRTPTGEYSLAYIPPMQAFWVRLREGLTSGTITFSNSLRAHADHTSNVLKSSEMEMRQLVRLTVSGSKNIDETLLYADSKASYGFDNYDSDKMFSGSGVELFTFPVDQRRELVINGLPAIDDGLEIPLGFQTDEGGEFSILAKEIRNIEPLNVYLRDSWGNTEHNLVTEGAYRFTAGTAYNTERFSIVFRNAATANDAVPDAGDGYLRAYCNREGSIVVLYGGVGVVNISVYDMLGAARSVQPVIPNTPTVLKGKFDRGIYILRAGKYAIKVFVQ